MDDVRRVFTCDSSAMPRRTEDFLEGELTSDIIDAMYQSHRELGFGFRELIYALALDEVLTAMGHRVDRQVSVVVHFRGKPLARQVMDMIVDDKVILEIKSTELLHPAATNQLFGYLCATRLEVGLLLHFGREARAHRVICENRYKRHGAQSSRGRLDRDHAGITDLGGTNGEIRTTDRSIQDNQQGQCEKNP